MKKCVLRCIRQVENWEEKNFSLSILVKFPREGISSAILSFFFNFLTRN